MTMRRWIPFTFVPLLACGPFFYQAPPTLEHYSERLATKSWVDLYKESDPFDIMSPGKNELGEPCRKLPEELKNLPTEEKLKRIDDLISSNRRVAYSAATANFLHELRELAADPQTFDASGAYLAWRVEHPADSLPRVSQEKPWNVSDEEFAKVLAAAEENLRVKREEFAGLGADAPPALVPYWKVQNAAFLFRSGAYQEAADIFSEVVDHYAGHPRAEVAALMLARCRLNEAKLEEARELLVKFIARYPAGRFTPDAHGWLGAVAIANGQLGLAVKHQLDRLDLQPTREITRTVLRECDFIFDKLFARTDNKRFEEGFNSLEDFDAVAVARHPLVARLFVQHALDPAAAEMAANSWQDNPSADRWTIEFLKQRVFRQEGFVAPALRALGSEMLKRSSTADETTLTVLAWAATEAGEHEQALALILQIRSENPKDEALHAKAIILQRLDRHAEAVAAFDALEKAYPRSPLVNDLPRRRAISQFHTGHAGEAFVGFSASRYGEGRVSEGLNPEFYEVQWADTLLQFAPLDQLAAAVDKLEPDSKEARSLRQAIRTRALAMHDFTLARNHLSNEDEAPVTQVGEDEAGYSREKAAYLNESAWQSRVAPLEELYAKLADPAKAAEKAKIELEIARFWWDHRGYLTMPGLDLTRYAASEGEKQDLLRRRNGLQLGFSRERIDAELDSRDEATQALAHALEAAKSGDPAIVVPALELANQCLFRRAEFSLYQKSRAVETDATKQSADISAHLKKLGAKAPLYATFLPAVAPWMPGDYNFWNGENAILAAISGRKFERWYNDDVENAKLRQSCSTVANRFEHPDPSKSLAQFRNELAEARRELNRLRVKLDPADHMDILSVVDRLDDLAAAISLPEIAAADFVNYAEGATGKLPPAFKSLIDFRARLVVRADSKTYPDTLQNDTPEGWTEFLTTYPDSPKAEAASLRRVRLIARSHRGRPEVLVERFPEAPVPGGYKRVEILAAAEEPDPATVLTLIEDHEKRFPNGRYRQDLNLLKAASLMDQSDLTGAVRCLLEILGDPVQGDLHQIAALNFCEISQRLLVTSERDAVVEAFRKNPAALSKLKLLVNGDTYLARLQPLMPWLEAEL